MTTVKSCETQEQWDGEILKRGGHPLQLWGWGEVKAAHNWKVKRVFVFSGEEIIGAAQLLIRALPFHLRLSFTSHEDLYVTSGIGKWCLRLSHLTQKDHMVRSR